MTIKDVLDKHKIGAPLSKTELRELERAGLVVEKRAVVKKGKGKTVVVAPVVNPLSTITQGKITITNKDATNTIRCVSCGFQSILWNQKRIAWMAQKRQMTIEQMYNTYQCRKCRAMHIAVTSRVNADSNGRIVSVTSTTTATRSHL